MELPSRASLGRRRTWVRLVAAAVLVLCLGLLLNGYLSAAGPVGATGTATDGSSAATPAGTPLSTPPDPTATPHDGSGGSTPATPTVVNATANASDSVEVESRINRTNVTEGSFDPDAELTVVTTQGFFIEDENADVVVFDEDGNVVFHDDSYRVYFDVDPVPGRPYTVEYLASRHLNGPRCEGFESYWCTRNVYERVDLRTGERQVVYERTTRRVYGTRYHDIDRINATHLVVADIVEDRVYVANTRTDEITWQWNASRAYSEDAGGKEGDWTHVNDVELLPDGRIMASMRNMDEVIFLRPGEGMLHEWTLGEDGNHEILYEQHNPDYIPEARGGPSVIVADSENNRIVEYHRRDGEWVRAWGWRDARLQWPRDADRLPGGNTLIVDSQGDRVLEVAENGSIRWSVHIGMPYDAERLGTGDESAGGEAVQPPGTGSESNGGVSLPVLGGGGGGGSDAPVQTASSSLADRVVLFLKDLLPSLVVNSLLYVAPAWVQFVELLVVVVFVLTALVWGGVEFYWSRWSVRGLLGRASGRLPRP